MKTCASSILFVGVVACSATVGAQEAVRPADTTVRGLTAADFPRVKKLADNVYSFEQIDPTKRIVTVNNLIVVTTGGVLIAESQGTVENTRLLVAAVAKLTPQPIKYVVVGSEHGDHTGGIAAFPAGVVFFAHPFSAPRIKQPTEPVAGKRVLTMGGTEIDVLFLGRAHTGGDLEVYLPREKILFMSEVFSNRIFPSMANGYPTEWVSALKKAEELDVVTYVPAHGFVDAAAILREEERNYRLAIERILAEGKRLHDAKVPVENAAASADFGPYAAWTRHETNAAGAIKRVYMELDGELKSAQAAGDADRQPTITLPPPLARVLTDYEAAWRARDAGALARLFADDGVVVPNACPPVKGRARVQECYANSGGPLSLRAIASRTDGEVGYIVGAYADKEGGPDLGKFTLTLAKGSDGRWLIVADMDRPYPRR